MDEPELYPPEEYEPSITSGFSGFILNQFLTGMMVAETGGSAPTHS